MRLKLFITIFLLIIFCQLYSQNNYQVSLPKIIPASPDAQALGKFGEIPVSLYTGVPDISIPIHKITVGDFSLPITLSYHSSGIKVEEAASSIGLGWALVNGGVINQSVNGINDLEANGFPNSTYRQPNHAIQSLQMNLDSTGLPYQGGYDYFYAKRVTEGTIDAQPDLFSYSFGGQSGKFYIDQYSQIHPIPLSALKFEYFTAGNVRFKITDLDGNKFYFGSAENSSFFNSCGSSASASIYLDKIVLKNRDSITYQYQPFSYSYKIHSSNARISPIQGQTSAGIQIVNLDCFGLNQPDLVAVNGLRLVQINSTKGDIVSFNYQKVRNDLIGSNALTSVLVNYNNQNNLKQLNLFQSYFTPPDGQVNIDPDLNRLKLDSVVSQSEIYTFSYNEQIKLPNRLSNAQDHWGYNNGKITNTTLLPFDYEKGFIDGADREVDNAYVKAATLEKITYPTGGFTLFEYEPNNYHYTGIEKTYTAKLFTLSGSPNISTYKYFTIAPNVDVLNAKATFVSNPLAANGINEIPSGNLCTVELIGNNNFYASWSNFNSPASGMPMNLIPGDYTMKVTTNGDYTNTFLNINFQERVNNQVDKNIFLGGLRISKISSFNAINDIKPIQKRYNYNDENSIFSSGQINFLPQYSSIKTYTTSIPEYDMENRILNYTFNDHQYWRQTSGPVFPLENIHGGSVGYKNVEVLDGNNGENGKTQSKFSFFGDNGGSLSYPLIPTISRDWNSGFLLEQATFKKSSNGFSMIKKENNFYSTRPESEFWNTYFIPNTFNQNDYLRGWGINIGLKHLEYIIGLRIIPAEFQWNDYHFLSNWVRLDSSYVKTYSENPSNVELANKTDYSYNISNLLPNSIKSKASTGIVLENIKYFPNDVLSNLSTDANLTRNEMLLRNQKAILLEDVFKKNDVIINRIRNNYTINNNNIVLSNIQNSLFNNNLETRASFNLYDTKGNILEMQKTNDLKEVYIWGYKSKVVIAKVIGSNDTTVSSFINQTILDNENGQFSEQDIKAELNKIRVGLLNTNAQVSTYGYKPLIGITSETDPNNHTKYYEYDAFNRLSLIKDQDNNILKKICYNYAGQVEDCQLTNSVAAQWRATGNTRCQPCAANAAYNSGAKEKEEKDINPNSPTYNSLHWLVDASLGTCPSPPVWQQRPDLASCETNTTTGANTGNQIIPTRDINPCSVSFGQWGASVIIANAAACPVGPPCTKACVAPQYKCINNVCVSGTWSVIKSTKISKLPLPNGTWECIRAWCFPDGTTSTYTETTTSTTPCKVTGCF
jgi:YD repeat-containing protein